MPAEGAGPRRWLPRSLSGQFALLHGGIALVAAATLPLGVTVLLHRVAHHYQREVLAQQVGEVAGLLAAHDPVRAVGMADIRAGGLTLSVIDRSRRVLAERGSPRPAMVAAVPIGAAMRLVRRGPLVAVSLPVGARWVIVTQDETAPEVVTDNIIRTFLWRFAILLVPLTLLIPLAGVWLTRRLTRRMTETAAIAAAIGPRTLDRRLPDRMLPLEVRPLATATNAALDRLEQGFVAQAAFAADVAHELRTPLAVMRLRADAVADAGTRQALLREVDRAARVVAQLLDLADLERPGEVACAPVDLAALAEAVVADRAPAILASGRGIAFADRGGATVSGRAGALILALENLTDNAMRHTPPGTRITVEAGPGARLRVTDDGPPVDPAHLSAMATRFWRAGNAKGEGSGLGLSIVARVAAAHDGRLLLAAGAGGRGLDAVLALDPALAEGQANPSPTMPDGARDDSNW